MGIDELERRIAEIRAKPLLLVCVMPTGRICTTTARECWASGGRFLHVADDEMDALLGVELGGDADEIAENRRFPQTKGGEALSNRQKRTKKT